MYKQKQKHFITSIKMQAIILNNTQLIQSEIVTNLISARHF